MLVVVVYHCILFWSGTWFTSNPAFDAAPLKVAAEWMNSFHIYGFTLVSGYIFYHVKYSAEKYGDFMRFLRTKAKRLLVPYGFAAVVWVIPMQLLFFSSTLTEVIDKYVLGASPSQLWFLLMLFGVFAIMWPLSNFVREHDIGGLVVVAVLWTIGLVGGVILPNFFQIWTACRYCVYFWIGMKLCQHGTDRVKKLPVWIWLVGDIALFSLIKCIPDSNILFKLITIGLNVTLNAVGAVMSFVVLGKLAAIVPWKNSKLFANLSRYSFPIYLFHQQLVYCTITLLNGKINPYLNAGVNLLFAIGGAMLISWGLMRFKVTRILIGEKR